MEESKSYKKDKYRALKVAGMAIITMAVFLSVPLGILFAIRVSEPVRNTIVSMFENNRIDQDKETPNITVTQDENVVINVVKNSMDSVVSIAISQLVLQQGEGVVDKSSNIGTGFIVDPNGIIITNQHVVSDTTASYKVITNEGKEYPIVEILRDDGSDIAILKVDAKELKPLDLGDSDNLVAGQTVIAIGTPLGEYAGSVTTGVISGLNRSVTTSSSWFGGTSKVYEDVIQTDAAVNPGNSGGPLISTEGKVIGVNFATTSGADNISFALPINRVKDRLEEYRTYGKFIKPYLGVSYQMVSKYEAMYYKDVVAGALIVSLDPNGPASKAGIKRSDIITKIEGKDVDTSLSNMIQSYDVDQEVELQVWNGGSTRSVKVKLIQAD